MPETNPSPTHPFLGHGGSLGAFIAQRDWSGTCLGPLHEWPGTIKSVLASWLDSPQAMFVAWGPELRFFFNEAYLPFLGARGRDMMGLPFHEVWPDVWSDVEPIVRRALAGEGQRFERLPLRMDRNGYSEQTWWTFTYMPLRDEAGSVLGMMCTTADATAEVLAAQRADQQRALQQNMLQQMPGFVCLLDGPDHVFEYLNDAYRSLAGEREYLGRQVRDVFPDLEGQGYFELLDDVYATGVPFVSQAMPLRLDGEATERFIDLLYYPMRDGEGNVTGIFAGGYEVSQRVQAELDLRALNETLELRAEERMAQLVKAQEALRQSQKVEAMGQLTGGVAHDFNNLLTVISSSVDLLRRPQIQEAQRAKYVETIADTVRRAAKLTNQLLAFARRQPLKPKVFDARLQIQSVSELVLPLLGPNISVHLPGGHESFPTECDLNQFETAIVNLAVNARDAMPSGGTLAIEVARCDEIPALRGQPARPGAFVSVSMRDSGVGIPPAQLDLVFDPFFTTKEVGKGTGLGLSQVFGFTRQSGGDVRVESTPGKGSRFTLYLPRAVTPADLAAAADAGRGAAIDAGMLTILVVEDNPEVGKTCTEILRDLGHTTVWAKEAGTALAILEHGKHGFDMVFSDVVMPGMNGIELAKAIRARYPRLPVLLCSGYSDTFVDDGLLGFELIRKPYSVDDLMDVMRKVLDQDLS